MKKKSSAARAAHLSLKSKSLHSRLVSYIHVVNHLLKTYAFENIMAGADTKTVRSTNPTNMSSLQYPEALWRKTFPCPQVYNKYVLKYTFLEGLPSSIRHSMHSFWTSSKHATSVNLAYKVRSLWKLGEEARVMDTSNSYQSPQKL